MKKINVVQTFPPITMRQFDWQATYDGYEPGDPVGYGETEQDAIDSLKDAAHDIL